MVRKAGFIIVLMTALISAASVAAQSVSAETISFEIACGDVTVANPEPSDLCRQVMALRPVPSYASAPLDSDTIDNYGFWKVTAEGGASVYGAPGGAVTRTLGGFSYVSETGSNADWVQIGGGEWMRKADLTYTEPTDLRGLLIDDGLPNDYAYILGNVITSPYPGAPADIATGVRKYYYNLVHIFASVELDGWRWYMVGPNQWVEQRQVSKVSLTERPEGVSGRWVAVDLYEQTMVAYEDDTPVFSTIVATGLSEWKTNEGLFEVWYRVPFGSMSGAFGAPDAYALQDVPWTLYFDGDISLHGTYWHSSFGFRRSHGCVNLSISDARWVFMWMREATAPMNEDGDVQNFVYVYSSDEYR